MSLRFRESFPLGEVCTNPSTNGVTKKTGTARERQLVDAVHDIDVPARRKRLDCAGFWHASRKLQPLCEGLHCGTDMRCVLVDIVQRLDDVTRLDLFGVEQTEVLHGLSIEMKPRDRLAVVVIQQDREV